MIFDLKRVRFSQADAGQMHVYLNYAREHWVQPGENPRVGIILCSGRSEALVRYATDALPNKLLVREYLNSLPDERTLAAELERTRRQLESRQPAHVEQVGDQDGNAAFRATLLRQGTSRRIPESTAISGAASCHQYTFPAGGVQGTLSCRR